MPKVVRLERSGGRLFLNTAHLFLLTHTYLFQKLKKMLPKLVLSTHTYFLRKTLIFPAIFISSTNTYLLQRLVEDKIARIQSDIVKNQQTIKEIKSYVRSMSHGDSAVLEKLQRVLDQQEASQGAELQGVVKGNQVKPQVYQSGGEVKLSGDMCSLAEGPNPESDIQVSAKVNYRLSLL